jgi:hypothetical protein
VLALVDFTRSVGQGGARPARSRFAAGINSLAQFLPAAHFLSRECCSACSGSSGSKVLPRQEQGLAAGFGLCVRFVMC